MPAFREFFADIGYLVSCFGFVPHFGGAYFLVTYLKITEQSSGPLEGQPLLLALEAALQPSYCLLMLSVFISFCLWNISHSGEVFLFCFILVFKTRFLCVALDVLELTL